MNNPITFTEYSLVDCNKQLYRCEIKESSDIINLRGFANDGQYHSFTGTDGLEFKQWAENLGMEPICMQRTITVVNENRRMESGDRIF